MSTLSTWEHTLSDWTLDSGVPSPTWASDCASWAPYDIAYGQLYISSTGSWATGFSATSVTISGTGLGAFIADYGFGAIHVYDTMSNTIGSLTSGFSSGVDSYTIPLTFVGYDLAHIAIDGYVSDGVTLCTVDFIYSATCTPFWTNSYKQAELVE